MKGPMVSIIIPVYNAENYLPITITSLLWQKNKDFEVLFVDDGSPDGSVELIQRQMQGSQLNWRLIQQENRGQGAARNTGFLEAKGEWVLFLDADDAVQDYTVDLCSRMATQYPDTDVIFSGYWTVDGQAALKRTEEVPGEVVVTREQLLKDFLTRKTVFLVPGTLYKREFLHRAQLLHTQIPWSEDQYFMWQVMDRLHSAVVCKSVLYNYVEHGGPSIMRSTPLDKMLSAYEQYRELPGEIDDPQVKKYLLPRWCLGCLHVFAHRGDRVSFDAFWKATGFTRSCKTLLRFPEWKIRILALAGLVCKPLMFRMMR